MFELKIKKLRTAEYNPRANELKEKSNECLKNFLTSHTKFSGENRDRWTREAAFAYNPSVHISSTFTLPKVMFGREYRVLIDVLSRFAKKKRNVRTFKILNVRGSIGRYYDKKVSESSCVKSIRIRSYSGPYFPAFGLNTERYGACLCIQSECGKIKWYIKRGPIVLYYNKKVSDSILKKGNLVYVLQPCNVSKRLLNNWCGVDKITRESHSSYEVAIVNPNGVSKRFITRDKVRLKPSPYWT